MQGYRNAAFVTGETSLQTQTCQRQYLMKLVAVMKAQAPSERFVQPQAAQTPVTRSCCSTLPAGTVAALKATASPLGWETKCGVSVVVDGLGKRHIAASSAVPWKFLPVNAWLGSAAPEHAWDVNPTPWVSSSLALTRSLCAPVVSALIRVHVQACSSLFQQSAATRLVMTTKPRDFLCPFS